jgi:hypothetical protein
MAASEAFERFLAALTQRERDALKELIHAQREDLFAARSEEAQLRIVHEFVREAHDRLQTAKR